MITTPNLGLKVWNLTTDPYNSGQLADNWARVDITSNKLAIGVNVPPDNTVTPAKLTSSVGNFGAWTAWTPQASQNGNKTSTNNGSRYVQIGKLVTVYCRVTITAAGTAGNSIGVDLPVTNYVATGDAPCGTFMYFRASGARYEGAAIFNSSFGTAGSRVLFHQNATTGPIGVDPSFATANGDILGFTVTYEAT